jgi:hypothetical protein
VLVHALPGVRRVHDLTTVASGEAG